MISTATEIPDRDPVAGRQGRAAQTQVIIEPAREAVTARGPKTGTQTVTVLKPTGDSLPGCSAAHPRATRHTEIAGGSVL